MPAFSGRLLCGSCHRVGLLVRFIFCSLRYTLTRSPFTQRRRQLGVRLFLTQTNSSADQATCEKRKSPPHDSRRYKMQHGYSIVEDGKPVT